jgi:hypothetical protein
MGRDRGGRDCRGRVVLILLSLGIGLGFPAISPWAGSGVSATLRVFDLVWLLMTQIFASGLGGYLARRLRTKWAYVHTDEVCTHAIPRTGFWRGQRRHGVTAAFLANAVASALGWPPVRPDPQKPSRRWRKCSGDGAVATRLTSLRIFQTRSYDLLSRTRLRLMRVGRKSDIRGQRPRALRSTLPIALISVS